MELKTTLMTEDHWGIRWRDLYKAYKWKPLCVVPRQQNIRMFKCHVITIKMLGRKLYISCIFRDRFDLWIFASSVSDTYEPHHDKTNKVVCAPSEDSDQPGHPPKLIRGFAGRSVGT